MIPIRSRVRAFFIGASILAGAFAIGAVITFFNPVRPRLENVVLDNTALGSRPEGCTQIHEFLCGELRRSTDSGVRVMDDLLAEKKARELAQKIREENPDLTPEQLNNKLVEAIYTPERRGRVLTVYRRVKRDMSRFISLQSDRVFSKREKNLLLARIERVSLELPPPAKMYADEPELFLKSDVFYEREIGNRLRLRIGGAFLLGVESNFNLTFTLAHELAHAIDPCEIRSAHFSIPAYDRLKACFMKQGLIDIRRSRQECVKEDQLSETFADWFAVQITADALADHAATRQPADETLNTAIVDSVRDLCEDPSSDLIADTEHHPSPRVRIERIFGENPTIQALLGCNSARQISTYCKL